MYILILFFTVPFLTFRINDILFTFKISFIYLFLIITFIFKVKNTKPDGFIYVLLNVRNKNYCVPRNLTVK